MSVFKRPTSRFYQYDFVVKGRRYCGSTGVETVRKAEEVERKIRQDIALGLYDSQAAMTLDEAAGRWWDEVGSKLATAVDVERRLEIVLRLLGKNSRLTELTTSKISVAIERRRAETYTKGPDRKGAPAKRYTLANATVNADIVSILRRIMTRAEKVWEVTPLKAIDWQALKLSEPEAEIRFYTAEQRSAWAAECDPVTARALHMLLTYGLRFSELFFPPSAFDPGGPRIAINKRKRGVLLLPLREDDGRDIASRVGRAKAADLDTIWFEEEVKPALGRRPEKITLVPLTYYGLQARLRSAAKRAGIDMSRLIHGARHHAGTMTLGQTGNLKLTQQLLGHADIKSTMRYAHALETDIRAALEAKPAAEESRKTPAGTRRAKRQPKAG